MFEECKGDKFEFINKIKNLAQETKGRVNQRLDYEQKIQQIQDQQQSLEVEKEAWIDYIDFEINQGMLKRAKLLYEIGLISLDRDKHFWISYIQFLEKRMKDPTLVRAKFENKLKHCDKQDIIDIMIENSLFEEDQQQIQKARKIYENLQNEIAPDYIKSLIQFINFEKRQKNTEKVKELYFKAYQTSLTKNEFQTVVYIVMQYARFLTFQVNDSNRAVEILDQTIAKVKDSKTLYLSYINFLKHLGNQISDSFEKCTQVFENAIDETQSNLEQKEREEIARLYLEFLNENCNQVSRIRNTEQRLKEKQLILHHQVKRTALSGHNEQKYENGLQNDSLLGKREHPETKLNEKQL